MAFETPSSASSAERSSDRHQAIPCRHVGRHTSAAPRTHAAAEPYTDGGRAGADRSGQHLAAAIATSAGGSERSRSSACRAATVGRCTDVPASAIGMPSAAESRPRCGSAVAPFMKATETNARRHRPRRQKPITPPAPNVALRPGSWRDGWGLRLISTASPRSRTPRTARPGSASACLRECAPIASRDDPAPRHNKASARATPMVRAPEEAM